MTSFEKNTQGQLFTQELGPATETWLPEIDDVEGEVPSVEERTNNIPLTSIMPLAMEMALKIENRQRSKYSHDYERIYFLHSDECVTVLNLVHEFCPRSYWSASTPLE